MSGRVKARPRASQPDMAQKALRDYQEIERRRSEQSAEKLLKEAAPRFREKGWKVTDA